MLSSLGAPDVGLEVEEKKVKTLVVAAKLQEIVKEYTKEDRICISKDLRAALELHVIRVIQRACDRAKENGRKTVMGKDV